METKHEEVLEIKQGRIVGDYREELETKHEEVLEIKQGRSVGDIEKSWRQNMKKCWR